MKKIIRNNVIGFVLAGLLCGAVTVISASQNLSSSSVEYKDSKSVSTALNELYAKESQLHKIYKIGDKIKVKNEDYYVIADSPRDQDYVTLLKSETLTVEEVNTYGGVGTEDNHVNMYSGSSSDSYYRQAYNENGYGGMAYYSSPTCGYNGDDWVGFDGCKRNYEESDIKYAVDAWAADKFASTDLREVEGYKARLVQFSELQQFYPSCGEDKRFCSKESTTPRRLYNSKYWYWTMSQNSDQGSNMWIVDDEGNLNGYSVLSSKIVVRPVINIYKDKI